MLTSSAVRAADAPAQPIDPIARALQQIYGAIASQPLEGKLADYIPELTRADPKWFGAVVATADGRVYGVGDVDVPFTIQSISKPLVYGMVLEACGLDETLAKVGVEPSGEAFNSISLYPETGRPFNPMINAGAIACSGLLHSLYGERTVKRVVQKFSQLSGRPLQIDQAVYESERSTGHRNRAIGHLLRNFEILTAEDVNGPLDAYFAQCSIQVTCRDLAMMGATLANRGANPQHRAARALPRARAPRAQRDEHLRDVRLLRRVALPRGHPRQERCRRRHPRGASGSARVRGVFPAARRARQFGSRHPYVRRARQALPAAHAQRALARRAGHPRGSHRRGSTVTAHSPSRARTSPGTARRSGSLAADSGIALVRLDRAHHAHALRPPRTNALRGARHAARDGHRHAGHRAAAACARGLRGRRQDTGPRALQDT